MSDISDLTALIASLGTVERSGAGLRREIDTSTFSGSRNGFVANARTVQSFSDGIDIVGPRDDGTTKHPLPYFAATSPVRLAAADIAGQRDHNLLDSSKFEKLPNEDIWPEHIRAFKETYESLEHSSIKLPVLRQMSPRSRRKLELMPLANAIDQNRAKKYERLASTANPQSIYQPMKTKKRPSGSVPPKLKRIDSSPMISKTSSNVEARGALRLPEVVPKVTSLSYYAQFNEYREKQACQQEAFKEMERAAAESAVDSQSQYLPKRGFHYPSTSKLLGLLHGGATDQSYKPAQPSDDVPVAKAKLSRDKKDIGKLNAEYTPVVREAIEIGRTLSERQGLLGKELDAIEKKIESSRKDRFMDKWRGSLYDDIGLDVDPAFNRRRIFGDAWKTLVYYVALHRLRAGMDMLHAQTQRTTEGIRSNAGGFLNRILWGHAARVRVWKIRDNIRQQREAEILHEKVEASYRLYNELKVFKVCFSYRMRVRAARLKLEKEKSINLQCFWRICLAKKRTKRFRRYFLLKTNCVIRIQCRYRRHLAARRVTFLKKYSNVTRWENDQAMKRHERVIRHRHTGAAYIIQRFYRAYMIKNRLRTLLYWHHFELAISVQRMARGYLARQRCRRQIARFRKMIKIKIKRITILQSLWRGIKGRERALRLREKKETHKAERRRRKAERLALLAQQSQLPALLLKYKRVLRPFRYILERENATVIQRVWRGHHGRRRRLIVLARRRVEDYFIKILKKWRGSRNIQRCWRGYAVRKRFIIRRKHRMAIKIQTQVRMRLASKKVKHRALFIAASTLLYSMVSRLWRCRKYRLLFMHNLRLRVPIRILQRAARKYIARKNRRARKDFLRYLADKRSSEALATYRALGCAQLAILQESMDRPMGKKATDEQASLCGWESKCFGPVQALFTYSITPGKALFDQASLPNNRMDSTAVLKLMQRMPDVYAGKEAQKGKAKVASIKPLLLKTKKKPGADDEMLLTLTICFNRQIILLPKQVKRLYQNDIDVAINKAKGSGGNYLTYEYFCAFLQAVATAIYEKCPIADDEQAGSFEESGDDSTMSTAYRHSYFFPYHDLVTKSRTYGVGMAGHILGSLYSAFLDKKRNTSPSPSSKSRGASSMAKVAADARDGWIADVIEWIEAESRARVGTFVKKIQRMVRRHRSKHILKHAKTEIWRSTENERLLAAHTKCQAVVRRFLTRVKVVKIAQMVLVRYVPHTGALYWHNPRTNVSQWTKPKILRGYDCVSIALPPPLLEYSIKCSNCTRVTAEVNCINCGDSFCRICFDSLHCKGKRRLHVFEKILMCCRCHYQCATKNCATCTLRRPKKGSIEALARSKKNFGNYCDTCFTHIHDAVDQGNTLSAYSRTVANELESGSIKDAYLVGQALHQRVITDHKFGDLVQPCEECNWRSAAWRCLDCDQVYCNKCLHGLHSIGGPFVTHTAEKLPYYPPYLHRQTLADSLAMRVADKIEKIKRAFQKKVEHERIIYCLMLQTWWRMIYYGKIGKALMKQRRLLLRRAYRVRKYEDINMRSTLEYKVKDMLGIAPALKSDTKEEKILKKFTIFRRQDIRRFIYQNKGDNYYVLKQMEHLKAREAASISEDGSSHKSQSSKPKFLNIRMPSAYLSRPKSRDAKLENKIVSELSNSRPTTAEMLAKNSTKGIPRMGFDCGTEKELLDQAKRGGWRMPGAIHMVTGHRKHETTMDLRPVLRRGEFARVKNHLFVVAEVSSNSVTLNRVWREESARHMLIFRLPSYADEKWRMYYEMVYKSYDVATRNVVAQTILGWQERLMGAIAEKFQERTKHQKKRGNMRGSQFWGRKAVAFQRRKAIATNLLADDVDVPKVKDMISPYVNGFRTYGGDYGDSDEEEDEIDNETRVKMARVVGKRWEATDREKMERSRAEKVLSREELALDAEFWEEHLDPMTNRTYYQDKETWEFMNTVPKSVEAKRHLDQEALDRQKSFESAKLSAKSSISGKKRR